jgi:hypothetical protein
MKFSSCRMLPGRLRPGGFPPKFQGMPKQSRPYAPPRDSLQ